jgi:hypothetical protein
MLWCLGTEVTSPLCNLERGNRWDAKPRGSVVRSHAYPPDHFKEKLFYLLSLPAATTIISFLPLVYFLLHFIFHISFFFGVFSLFLKNERGL